MNNEIRNILINVNILKNYLQDIDMNKETREKVNFRLSEIIDRINYLIEDQLDVIKYKEKTLQDNKRLINEILKGGVE